MHDPLVLILVVEDDLLIQEAVRSALMEGGFEADLSSSGEEAVALLEAQTANYRALITDINLQGRFTGWDVAKRARELNAEIPVIYMSGAAADQWHSHGVPNSLILQKPFAPAQVVTAVSQLLNQISPIPRE
ncbi:MULTISPECIES: response regulator [Bradyrhizobium]|uniref:response regulator n=1 Tax=Bradyrhizobium TaxID=374 RepID=UPI0020A18350|nr:response regulator [Bradyrhizobium japonicum]MCP1768620.1 DNA-binding response OmpR family regulator [Bradyrhizobium japonicum]MCP1794290.1 DNA-binding response OmpR family regulator [Bradyrhizobium japonicum]MCP1810954.1 DNA-binding response OmpR family regulator [Bradyrhizobium japonicum]MCP1821193.1 DNA-binding response OmpR family regulator [Bradyrhizobium japonicum]MCP1876229.1 DNA-binding response OmpR family regulator [Bradyrhizobium japonicum]